MNCSRSAAFQYFDIFKDSAAYPYNDSSTNTTYKCKACFLKYKDEVKPPSPVNSTPKKVLAVIQMFRGHGLSQKHSNSSLKSIVTSIMFIQ